MVTTRSCRKRLTRTDGEIRGRFGRRSVMTIILCLVASFAGVGAAEPATWARGAIALECKAGSTSGRQRIQSPDRRIAIELTCRSSWPVALRVIHPDGHEQALSLEKQGHDLWRPQELLWSPDSRMFVVNGSENAYSGFAITVYEIRPDRVLPHDMTNAVQRDMTASFPPCRAADLTEETCRRLEKDPAYNVSALAWAKDSSRLIVFVEVPCSSSYGGIMCQAQGYELEVPSGRILTRMSARDLKRLWQSSAAWNIRIPEPPAYRRPAMR